mgnify:FL=1
MNIIIKYKYKNISIKNKTNLKVDHNINITMKLKIIIPILLILFLVTSCITVEVADETPEEVEEEIVEEEEEPEPSVDEEEPEPSVDEEEIPVEDDGLPENQYKITYDGTITVEGMNIGINSMGSSAEVTLNIDGIDSILRETKTKEIYNNYYFSLQEYTYKGSSDESFIIIEVTPFVLEEDQYLIQRSSTLNVLDKDITLDDSKSDGYIVITVCDEGTLFCEEIETILKGDTEEIRGVNIKNVEHFYRVYQYAILEVTEI